MLSSQTYLEFRKRHLLQTRTIMHVMYIRTGDGRVKHALQWPSSQLSLLPIHYLFITYSITYSITYYPCLGISYYLFEKGINELS